MNEGELILCDLLDCNRTDLYLKDLESTLDSKQQSLFSSILKKREKGEPIQYILGSTEFFGLEFKVCPGVFIPRPETEILVEKAIGLAQYVPNAVKLRRVTSGSRRKSKAVSTFGTIRNTQYVNILDIGTGSGNIAISLAKHIGNANITAIDISQEAIDLAKENAQFHAVEDKIKFIHTDFLDNAQYVPNAVKLRRITSGSRRKSKAVSTFGAIRNSAQASPKGTQYDMIISNPPYIKSADLENLQPEVRHEPRIALDGGEQGLNFYQEILLIAKHILNPNGILLFEIGFPQAESIRKIIAKSSSFLVREIIKDFGGIERVMLLSK